MNLEKPTQKQNILALLAMLALNKKPEIEKVKGYEKYWSDFVFKACVQRSHRLQSGEWCDFNLNSDKENNIDKSD